MASPQVDTKPHIHILHGDDAFAIKRRVEELVSELGDRSIADLNITRLDGKQAREEEILSAANSMPFLSDRRMLVLTSPFARAGTDAGRKRFQAFLDAIPPSTILILIVEDLYERKDWKSLPQVPTNWIRKWLTAHPHDADYHLFQLPAPARMAEWIREETRRQGGQIKPDAATALASHVGNDPQQASLEITKLLTYVDFKRAVQIEDVEELTAQAGQTDVFAMVDALAQGSTRQALHLLMRLLETQDPLSLFGMITRQYRLILQARELLDQGRGNAIQTALRLHPYVAEKVTDQARRFSMPQLEKIYHRLLEMDEGMKTSQMPPDLALQTFIAEMGR